MYRYFIGQIFWNPEIIGKTSVDVDDLPLGEEREIFSAMKDINYIGEVINEMSVSKKTGISMSKIID